MASTARPARLRLVAVAAAVAVVISGCAAGQISQTAQQVAAIDGANATVGGMGIRDVRFAPTDLSGYAAGASAPLRLWVLNDGQSTDTLKSVSSPAAGSVTFDGSAELIPQAKVEIGEDSDIQVTLKDLKQAVPYGHSIPVTFSFANAGDVTVNVPIEIPMQREDDARATVDILPAEHGNIWFGSGAEGTEGGH